MVHSRGVQPSSQSKCAHAGMDTGAEYSNAASYGHKAYVLLFGLDRKRGFGSVFRHQITT